jgi:uncharacterized protein YciI
LQGRQHILGVFRKFAPNPATMFAVHSIYLKPIEEVDTCLDAHRAWLKELYAQGITICSGPQIPRNGGFILMNGTSKDDVLRLMKNDPYVIHGMAQYAVIEFEVKSCAPGFRDLIS